MASGTTVLKEGFLKKQGGRMRTWKNRYFSLSENGTVTYYNGQDKNKKINEFSLKGTELCVIPIDPYDSQNGVKYLFEIRGGKFVCFSTDHLMIIVYLNITINSYTALFILCLCIYKRYFFLRVIHVYQCMSLRENFLVYVQKT